MECKDPSMSKHFPYCEVFGFDKRAIATRLKLMDMGKAQEKLAVIFQQKILSCKQKQIIDGFYEQMTQKSEFEKIILHGDFDLSALKRTQAHYIDTLGVDFCSMEYFEDRLRIGWIHVQVGVPLSLYQSAYRALQELMIAAVCEVCSGDAERMELMSYVLKISNLDMSLAITAYYHTQVNDLQTSLKHLQTEQLQLRHKANTDSLTGLPTREIIKNNLVKGLLELHDHSGTLYVIMADLDFFKNVNDQYGHLTGDHVLKDVANRIRQALRDVDIVGRYGGEEFIILLKNKNLQQAQLIAERVRVHVGSSPINANGQPITITLSQGLACGHVSDSAEDLIERADKALYEAKRSGRNCVITIGC